jgi:hypothetical protein
MFFLDSSFRFFIEFKYYQPTIYRGTCKRMLRKRKKKTTGTETSPGSKSLRTHFVIIAIVYITVAVTSFVLLAIQDPLFSVPFVDEATYQERAQDVLDGRWNSDMLWQEPLPLFYFTLLRAVGFGDIIAIKAIGLFVLNPLVIIILYLFANKLAPKLALPAALVYACNPVILFTAMSGMKTVLTILLYLLCLFFYNELFNEKKVTRSAMLFSLFFILSWLTRQHIILFLPVMLFFLYKNGSLRGNRALITATVSIIITMFITLVTVSLLLQKPMITITDNGGINFYIANNPDYDTTINTWPGYMWHDLTRKIDDGVIKPYEWLGKPWWFVHILRKTIYEFTPWIHFRQYYWWRYVKLNPFFILGMPLLFLLKLLPVTVCFKWKTLQPVEKVLLTCLGLFHLVNIIYIPGIARYHAVMAPVSIYFALKGLIIITSDKRLGLISIPFISLLFFEPPNDFKGEYMDYIEARHTLSEERLMNIAIPAGTRHKIDWKLTRAEFLFLEGKYREALQIVISVNQVDSYSKNDLKARCLAGLGLYLDAFTIYSSEVERGWGNFSRDMQILYQGIIMDTENMIQSYNNEGLLTAQKRNEIADFLRSIPNPGNSDLQATRRWYKLIGIADSLTVD